MNHVIKICGITRTADALHASRCGATALGFVFWPESPRYIAPECADAIARKVPCAVAPVGVFVNQPLAEVLRVQDVAGFAITQLHGEEPPSYATDLGMVWRALSLADAEEAVSTWPADTIFLLDAHDPVRRGGTGRPIDWAMAASIARRRRVILAGGLTPENVQEAIATVRPFGVDVSSGVEEAPGVKDPGKVARFIERARAGFNGH